LRAELYAISHAQTYTAHMSTTVRVTESTRARAALLAAQTGVSIGEVVDQALTAYETNLFWAETHEALTRNREQIDDEVWDQTVRDRPRP
jgi:hypothetical protein